MTSFVNPTYYRLQKATIRFEYLAGDAEYDVTSLIPSLSINFSIESETLYGKARFIDSVGLLEGTDKSNPLRGEEQIIFELADSKTINATGGSESGNLDNPYRFVCFIYKIDNVSTKEVNDALVYDVHFISYQAFKAGTHEIIRAFKEVTVSDIVETIFTDYYLKNENVSFIPQEQRKPIEIEETDGVVRCTIPKLRPEEAMTFLSRRAYSSDSPSCSFMFFESSRAFNFVTYEKMLQLAEENPDRLFKLTYLDAIPNTLEYFDAQINNLEVIENTSRVNTLDDLYNGAYRNKVFELDIISRQLNLLDEKGQYDYFDRRRSYFQSGDNVSIEDRHTQNFIRSIQKDRDPPDYPQKKFLIVANYTTDIDIPEQQQTGALVDAVLPADMFYAEITSNRQAYKKHIESITVDAIGPGRFDITAGDIIDLDVKKFQNADGDTGKFVLNERLSGKYIVKSVAHIMEREVMKNSYVLIKKDWSKTTEVYDDAILRTLRRQET
jgi:hypothetical protein